MQVEYRRKAGSRRYRDYTDGTLEACLQEIRSGQITQRAAEVKYKISRRTINYKLKKKHSNKPGGQAVFNKEEERVFADCLIHMSSMGFPVSSSDLKAIITCYLSDIGRGVKKFKANLYPGNHWVDGFLKRHKDLSIRVAANVKKLRAGLTRDGINEYFLNLKREIEGIPSSHIFSFDEMNLTDDPDQAKVITRRGTKYPQKVINSLKSAVSIMFCGSASGVLLPPFVVYKSTQLWSTWCDDGPNGTKYNHTSSGWFDCATFTAWVRDLVIPQLRNLPGKKVLIGDNLASHFSISALELLKTNDIILICLPPNTTHLTQPLDKAVFRPVKHHWQEILWKWKETNSSGQSSTMDKKYFPFLLSKLWEAISPNVGKNLVAGFESCGIHPIEENKILRFLDQPQLVNDFLHASFIEAHDKKREEWAGMPKPRKRKRIHVEPGKSVAGTNNNDNYMTYVIPPATNETATLEDSEEDVEIGLLVDDSDNETLEQQLERYKQEKKDEDEFDNMINNGINEKTFRPVKKAVGEYVVVMYEGSKYPGKITGIVEEKVTISAMQKTEKSWRWPTNVDEVEYDWDEVLGRIDPPKPINKRGYFEVKELMNAYSPTNVV